MERLFVENEHCNKCNTVVTHEYCWDRKKEIYVISCLDCGAEREEKEIEE